MISGKKMFKCMKCGNVFQKLFSLFHPKCPFCGSRWVFGVDNI